MRIVFKHIALLCAIALLAAACSSDDASTSADSAPADTGADGPSPDAPPAKAASVCGTIEDDAGAPLENFELQLCSELLCLTDRSDSSGQYCIRIENPATYVLHAIALDESAGKYGELLLPFDVSAAAIAAEQRLEVGTVVVPALGPAKQLDVANGGTVDLSFVTLEIAAGITEPPLFAGDTIDVAAAQQTPATLDAHIVGADPRIAKAVAAVGIMPIKTKFKSGIGLTLGGASASPDQQLTILHVDPDTAAIEVVGEAKASSDGATIVASAGRGPTTLGWLIFVPQ